MSGLPSTPFSDLPVVGVLSLLGGPRVSSRLPSETSPFAFRTGLDDGGDSTGNSGSPSLGVSPDGTSRDPLGTSRNSPPIAWVRTSTVPDSGSSLRPTDLSRTSKVPGISIIPN